ncbi:hypothetical protein GUITHDRAFT_139548 [Guillardia theta CCMP2712]|uniref:Prolyl 4-hydroxylase alpha subunit domain-containing protein n=1 Tax=Guillardia theta (strain CCMP2712) TaxID=905079 RepID=L1J882_GUITC|nr:hypothetical protein GUITHDRAFT_139548 [Guillardia theta CCMP2712]EKX44746.1 hypothetical protein GUITHDRAFT_139548 [Guillardia theta CCMP2712]|eukprot:XP_005831726.1 hypothetical protein GUITHDRAFT_139548 [Guillardia theta CCMP2712]
MVKAGILLFLYLLVVCMPNVSNGAHPDSDNSATGKRQAEFPVQSSSKSKKSSVESAISTLPSPIVDSIFSEEHRKALKNEYETSGPYPHCLIKTLCSEERLRAVHDELVNNLTANLKESDLFKVYQTCDLANLGRNGVMMDLAEKLPQLISLREAIYSQQFRELVKEVTGCGELSDQVDCATNLHTTSCHLLCHDDVIGTRKVSYIIYLTSPDEEWKEEDGGALELYPSAGEGIPKIEPSKVILPIFNSLAMFKEVYTEKPRMSIQGWFHGPKDTSTHSMATVNQLISKVDNEDPFHDYDDVAGDANAVLTEEDKEELSSFINSAYLKPDAIGKMLEKFQEESHILLYDFLSDDVIDCVRELCCEEDRRHKLGQGTIPKYEAGYGEGWEPIGPPHMRRYLKYDGQPAQPKKGSSVGAILQWLKQKFVSAPFLRFLKSFTSLKLLSSKGECRRFRPGLDYTVAHYGSICKQGRLNLVWCTVDDQYDGEKSIRKEKMSKQDKMDLWSSGDVGGFECYVEAEEETTAEASDVFKMDDDDGPLLQVLARSNTMSVVLQVGMLIMTTG